MMRRIKLLAAYVVLIGGIMGSAYGALDMEERENEQPHVIDHMFMYNVPGQTSDQTYEQWRNNGE